MKNTRHVFLLAGLVAVAPDAFAQMQVSGSVTGGVISSDVKGKNAFRFDEYRDLSSGATLGAEIKGESEKMFIRFFGENIGRDDQFLELTGGEYGMYKYSIYNNNIIHNLTHNAIAPFTGIGTKTLNYAGGVAVTPSLDTTTWGRFDYSVKHENYGGTFELQSSEVSPFYLRATLNQKETSGIKPLGASTRITTGSWFAELPVALDFTTTDASLEAGYARKNLQFGVNLSYSKFQDHNDYQNFRNPGQIAGLAGAMDRMTVAADNDLWKVAANAMIKQLPLSSTLALRGTYSKTTNSLPVAQDFLLVGSSGSSGGAGVGFIKTAFATTPSVKTFNGDVINESFSASLTSQLARSLDSRVYLNWNKKENHSTEIEFSTAAPPAAGSLGSGCKFIMETGTPTLLCDNEGFHYKKTNIGVDLQYRVTRHNKLSGGWDYTHTERAREDFEKTKDNKVYIEWKNTSLDTLTAKVKLQHLERRSPYSHSGIDATLPGENYFNYFELTTRRFDLNSKNENKFKVSLDASPMPFLDFGGGITWKSVRYKPQSYPSTWNVNTVVALPETYGRKSEDRYEIDLNATYGDPNVFRVSAFANYQINRYKSEHWSGNPAFVDATGYGWRGKWKDRNDLFGISADWPIPGNWRLKGAYIVQSAKGTVGYERTDGVSSAGIGNFDNYRKQALDLKGIYSINKNFELLLGFAREKFRLDDVAFNNYNNTIVVSGGQNYLSGAYANPNFTANVVYARVKYTLN